MPIGRPAAGSRRRPHKDSLRAPYPRGEHRASARGRRPCSARPRRLRGGGNRAHRPGHRRARPAVPPEPQQRGPRGQEGPDRPLEARRRAAQRRAALHADARPRARADDGGRPHARRLRRGDHRDRAQDHRLAARAGEPVPPAPATRQGPLDHGGDRPGRHELPGRRHAHQGRRPDVGGLGEDPRGQDGGHPHGPLRPPARVAHDGAEHPVGRQALARLAHRRQAHRGPHPAPRPDGGRGRARDPRPRPGLQAQRDRRPGRLLGDRHRRRAARRGRHRHHPAAAGRYARQPRARTCCRAPSC